MTRHRSARGHRRTKKASEGDPRKVRAMKIRRTVGRDGDACVWPDPWCPCLECDPDGTRS